VPRTSRAEAPIAVDEPMIEGRYVDRDEVFEAGDAYYGALGHLPLIFAGMELVEFSPSDALGESTAVIGANLEAAKAASAAGS
jgi:hypothetical protein